MQPAARKAICGNKKGEEAVGKKWAPHPHSPPSTEFTNDVTNAASLSALSLFLTRSLVMKCEAIPEMEIAPRRHLHLQFSIQIPSARQIRARGHKNICMYKTYVAYKQRRRRVLVFLVVRAAPSLNYGLIKMYFGTRAGKMEVWVLFFKLFKPGN
jgi:hypothetical protein